MDGQNIGSNPIHVSRESSNLSRSPRTGVKGCGLSPRKGLEKPKGAVCLPC